MSDAILYCPACGQERGVTFTDVGLVSPCEWCGSALAPWRGSTPRPPGMVRLSPAEQEVWDLVGRAADAYLRLCGWDPCHPHESSEIAHAFHDIQARLAARPVLKSMGWPRPPWRPTLPGEPVPLPDDDGGAP